MLEVSLLEVGVVIRLQRFLCNTKYMGKRNERLYGGGVSVRSRNGAPSRKGCVINGQMTKASNQ